MVHKKKLMSKIRKVIVEDVILTLGVIIERSNYLVRAGSSSDGLIELESFVDGYEGSYHIIRVDVRLVSYGDQLVPKVIIESLETRRVELELVLPQITVGAMTSILENNIIGREKKLKEYLLEETQAERIDFMETVSRIVDSISDDYFITGVSRYSKNLI